MLIKIYSFGKIESLMEIHARVIILLMYLESSHNIRKVTFAFCFVNCIALTSIFSKDVTHFPLSLFAVTIIIDIIPTDIKTLCVFYKRIRGGSRA